MVCVDKIPQLLQRTYPGQLPQVRRDIHNIILPLDLSDVKDAELIVESLQTFVKRKIPIRFGIVPLINSAAAIDQAKIVYHLQDTYGLGAALAYIEAVSTSSRFPKFRINRSLNHLTVSVWEKNRLGRQERL